MYTPYGIPVNQQFQQGLLGSQFSNPENSYSAYGTATGASQGTAFSNPWYTPSTGNANPYRDYGYGAGNNYGNISGGYTPPATGGGSASGGFGDFGGLDNIGSVGKSFFGPGGFSGGPASTINQFGSSLGFGSGLQSAPGGLIGPFAEGTGVANVGSLGTSATLQGTLGAAGIGAFAGNFLGRIGGNPTGGSIGGGLGAGIGFAVGGPVGGVVGGLIGGIGGGFFGGKKKPTSASEFLGNSADVATTGTLSGLSYGAKNAGSYDGYNKNLSAELGSVLKGLHPFLGVENYAGVTIRGGVNTLHSGSGQPGFIQIGGNPNGGGGEQIGFNPNDASSRQQAILQAASSIARQSGASDEAIASAIKQWVASNSPQGQASQNMPFIPIQNDQTFSKFMNAFNQSK